MAIRKDRGRWCVEFQQAGHRVFKRLPPLATQAEAKAFEARARREIFEQAHLGAKPHVTIGDAVTEWLSDTKGRKSAKANGSHAKQVCDLVGDESLLAVVSAAEKVRADGQARELSNATINRRLCVLKAAAKACYKRGWTDENLSGRIQTLPEGPGRQVYLTAKEAEALIDATAPRSRAYVALAIYTGLRQSQVLALTPKNASGGAVRLPDSKGGVPLTIPLVDAAKPFLRALPFKLHKRTYYADFEDAREAIGRPTLRYHDLRHTTASLMVQAGVPLFTIGELLGHRSLQTTKRYAHLNLDNKRAALTAAFPSKSHPRGQNLKGKKAA